MLPGQVCGRMSFASDMSVGLMNGFGALSGLSANISCCLNGQRTVESFGPTDFAESYVHTKVGRITRG